MTAHLELTDTVNSSGQVSASAVTVLQSTLPITLIVTALIIVTVSSHEVRFHIPGVKFNNTFTSVIYK